MSSNNNQMPQSSCDEPEPFCKMSEEEIDYNVMDSFPASEPPSINASQTAAESGE